jgi:hypothetical protein
MLLGPVRTAALKKNSTTALKGGYLRWRNIIQASLGCAVILPLVHFGRCFINNFLLYDKDMDNMKTRAENRGTSIGLSLKERLAQLFSLARTQTPEQFPLKIRGQNRRLVYLRRSGNWRGTCLNLPTSSPRSLIPGALGRAVPKGRG